MNPISSTPPSRTAGFRFSWKRTSLNIIATLAQIFLALTSSVAGHNVFLFLTWFCLVASLGCLTHDLRRQAYAKGQSLPAFLNIVGSMIPAVICAARGQFWLAGAWAWLAVAEQILYTLPDEDPLPPVPPSSS